MNDENVKARIRKLLALAERGVGGEKETANRMLNKMLDRHGMTLDDLRDDRRSLHPVKCANAFERRLVSQIISKVQNSPSPKVFKVGRACLTVHIEVTPAELVEFSIHWEALRKDLAKCLGNAYVAFVHTNNLFPADPGDAVDEPMTPERMADIEAITAMMRGMEPTAVHHRLERR